MSSGYNERGGYGQQQQPGGYPQQGYGAPPAQAPRPPQGPVGAAPKSGPPAGVIWALLVIASLNLLLTAYMAYAFIKAQSDAAALQEQLTGSLGDLGNLQNGLSGSLGG
jgi:hypothetical protein